MTSLNGFSLLVLGVVLALLGWVLTWGLIQWLIDLTGWVLIILGIIIVVAGIISMLTGRKSSGF